ncbi:restriction endonuclease subunit S [Streptococcus parasuis]|uniref:restriction endonuclease subunit S n=1 Tax=Streptococcus parasuis TaxID=1501662 RepID=UPI001C2C5A35|nr:restriction endonuclease subunit S [Streptococcus parasuis]MBV1944241.1 restriction endonuclease subunit S [Streptococcus parasuis]QXF05315.1 restriction endonuclease subunit S [Streptococcus parasuis]
MTRMKDSGIEWIGEVPEEWGITKFKFLGTAKNGLTYSPENIVEQTEGVLVLRSGNIQNNKLVFDNNVYVNSQIEPSIFLKKGDILITARNGSANLIGKNAIVEEPILATYGAFMMVFRVNKRMKSKFAYYLMNSSFDFYRNFFTTSTVNQLTAGIFYNIEVPLPTIIEQTKIADFLDKKVAQLDKVKSLLEEQIKTLEDYRQSLIYETVTKGLDKTVPLKDSGVDWIGQIPEGWEVKKHKYIMSKTKTLCSHYSGQKILSLTRQGVISRDVESGKGKMPASFDGYQFLTRGDLLLCLFDIDVTPRCVGVVESDGLTSPAYSRFKVSEDSSAYYYYYLFLSMDDDKVLLHLAKNLRNSLTEDDFGDIKTIVPPYKEQEMIANYLNKKTVLIDKLIQLKKEQIENINKQRQTLIYDYVTGKRRV